ncbi:KH domain-containing protein [bacterium]|nr:KH domain-containing protein [bacterium]
MDLKTIQELQGKVEEILQLMGVSYITPEVSFGDSEAVSVELTVSEDSEEGAGIIIGNHGETLLALEYIVALILNSGSEGEWRRVEVDIDGYRKRREQELSELAHRMAQKALESHQEIHLKPMSPADRRIVHTNLSKITGITTESDGQGRSRHIVIKPE